MSPHTEQGPEMRRIIAIRMIILASALAPAVAVGRDPMPDPTGGSLIADISSCRKIAEPLPRLACYDASVGKIADAAQNKDIVVLNHEDIRATKRSLFGFSLPKLPFFGDDDNHPDKPAKEEFSEIQSTIRSARPNALEGWTIVLEDGAVWQSTEAPDKDPKVGDTIRIRKAAMGSFFANIAKQRAVRIHRVG
jgi:hypothetical protein